jgi:uncharacterized delta-60 repeat protein
MHRLHGFWLGLLISWSISSTFAQTTRTGISIIEYPDYLPIRAKATRADSSTGASQSFGILAHHLQSDGSLVLFGKCQWAESFRHQSADGWRYSQKDSFELFSLRVTPEGQVDQSYGKLGWLKYTLPPIDTKRKPHRLFVTYSKEGKWTLGMDFQDEQDFLMTRFNADGSLDTTFRQGWVWFHDSKYRKIQLHGMFEQADGKIRMLSSYQSVYNNRVANLIQLNSSGERDTTFDGEGVKELLEQPLILDYQVLPDGRFLLLTYNCGWLEVHRFLADASPDLAYASAGRLKSDIERLANDAGASLWPDGTLILQGNVSKSCDLGRSDTSVFSVLHYNPQGQARPFFADKNESAWELGTFAQIIDGATLAVVKFENQRNTLSLYNREAQVMPRHRTSFNRYFDWASIIALAQGSTLLLGEQGDGFLLARQLPDGRLDKTYGQDTLSIRQKGYQLSVQEEMQQTKVDLSVKPTYTLVGGNQKYLAPVLLMASAHDWPYAEETRNIYQLEPAVRASKDNHAVHLQLQDVLLDLSQPQWKAIPADRLKGLSLRNCRLVGDVHTLQRFHSLEFLEISFDPDFTLSPAEQKVWLALIASFPNLKGLVLTMPGLKKANKVLSSQQNLQWLMLNLPQMEQFPKIVLQQKHLQRLALTFLCPEGIPDEINALKELRTLGLRGTGPKSKLLLPATLGDLANLQELTLENGAQVVALPASLVRLSKLYKLELHNAKIEALPSDIGQCQFLDDISIVTTGRFAAMPTSFFNLRFMDRLNLSICQADPALLLQEDRLQNMKSYHKTNFYIHLYP